MSTCPSAFWWPIYLIQFMEYFVWTLFNKYLLTLLTHHCMQLVSGLITGGALSSFLSWVAQLSDPLSVSLVYLALSAYSLGHSLCGILYYVHWAKKPRMAPAHLPITVLSPAGYTGTCLGLYVFSFWMKFPLDPIESPYWSAVVFPCLALGFIAQQSGVREVQPMSKPYRERDHDEDDEEEARHLREVANHYPAPTVVEIPTTDSAT